ncbi:MAG: cell division protein FtsA [Tidjanibacter sp.]|nr:cell division protein FtsA [Tidjanibacter sp.]
METNNFITVVDLGCNNLVAAVGTLNPSGKIDVLDAVLKPMVGIVRGEVNNIEQVTLTLKEAVTELEQRNGIKIGEASVSISGDQIVSADNSGFVYVGEDGEIKEEDVRKLTENMDNIQAPEGRTILTRIPQSYRVDSEEVCDSPVGMFGRRLEATFTYVLGSNKIIERQKKAFDRVGIARKEIFPAALAAAEAVTSDDERETGVAVVDLGAGTSDLCIFHNRIARYAVSIPIGANAINKDIRDTAIPERFIEDLKIQYGYATASAIPAEKLNFIVRIPGRTQREKNKDISYRDLSTIIEARLLDVVDYVINEIKESGYHNRLGAGIVLTGGGSLMPGIDVLFKERTGYDVRLASTENLTEEGCQKMSDPRMSCAAGLLMMSLAKNANLTPVAPVKKAEPDEVKQETPDKQQETPATTNQTAETPKNNNKKESDDEKPAKEEKKRGSLRKWLREKTETFFGVVDDDEI